MNDEIDGPGNIHINTLFGEIFIGRVDSGFAITAPTCFISSEIIEPLRGLEEEE